MFIISQPCSLELCLYKVKRGNFGITVQKYPHTQQHIIHKAPRLYITKIYIDRTWSVQCIIQLLFRNWGFPELGCKLPILGYPLLDGRQSAPV